MTDREAKEITLGCHTLMALMSRQAKRYADRHFPEHREGIEFCFKKAFIAGMNAAMHTPVERNVSGFPDWSKYTGPEWDSK